jgi:hypothetical protein
MKFFKGIVDFVFDLALSAFQFAKDHLGRISAHTLGWITIVLLHFAAIPTLIAVLLAQSDKLPPVDLMIFVWSALTTLFFKSLIEKNFLYIATICLGFLAQTVLMGLILFK